MEALTDSYMLWCYHRDHGAAPEGDVDMGMKSTHHIRVMDIYGEF